MIEGLVISTILVTIIMLMWNYFLTPYFGGYSKAAVSKILFPAILPFNLIKGALNSFIIILIYKPVMNALIKSNIIEPEDIQLNNNNRISEYLILAIICFSIIFLILAVKNIL